MTSTAAAIATCVKLAKNCATAEPEAFHVDDALPLTVHSKGTKGRHKGMVLQGVERRRGGGGMLCKYLAHAALSEHRQNESNKSNYANIAKITATEYCSCV